MKKFVVLGGGTAGWLTALFMKKSFPDSSVSLIQSKEIGIIGVGEATTPIIVGFLKELNIDPIDVIRETKGSIKNGIHFENWNGGGKQDRYFHGFKDNILDFTMDNMFDSDCLDFYLKNLIKNKLNLEEYNYQIHISYKNMIDLDRTEWALHFDTNLLSNFLQKIGVERGINLIEGTYSHVTQDEQGFVRTVHLKENTSHDCDFIFDCSGFARLIIDGVYKEKWISFSKHLPMKKGIPFWLENDEEVEPYTSAIAMKYGWIWKIPLQHRIGSGYIFDSDYIDENQALEEAEQHFGRKLEVRRIIPFEAGRFDRYWVKNCIAVGLASSFIEPLESTSIFLSVGELQTFRHFFNEIDDPNPHSVKLFNEIVANNMDDTLSFVYFHYLTKRKDSKFWQEFRDKCPPPKKIEELLPLIREANLRPHNVSTLKLSAYFALYSYLQVGYGLQIFDKEINVKNFENIKPSIEEYKTVVEHFTRTRAVKLKDFFDSVNK